MHIKEILRKYKNRILKCELGELKTDDFGDISRNILDDQNFLSSLLLKEYFIIVNNPKRELDLKEAKNYFLYELNDTFLKKDAWNRIKLDGDFKKEDFDFGNLRKCSESEKTKRLLFLLRNYKHIIEDEKNNMLSYSAMVLENNKKNPDDTDIEARKQAVQARYEIYKYLTGNETEDEIPRIYKIFIENMGNNHESLLDILKNKDFDKFISKKNKYYREMFDELNEKISKEDIAKLIDFFKDIKRKFKFSFESIITDLATYSNYLEEMNTIERLEKSYTDILKNEIKEEEEKAKQELRKKYVETLDTEAAKKQEEKAKPQIKKPNPLDYDEGNSEEYLEFFKENPIPDSDKENVRILFIHWIFHEGKSFESVLNKEKRDILFDRIKKITQASDKKVSIFICSDDKEDNLRGILDSFNNYLKEYNIDNVILEGASGEHGRFMIDSQGRRFKMYEMPKETSERIIKAHNRILENFDEYLDRENESYIQYTLPCSKKNGERITDYVITFRRNFFLERKNIKYYPVGENKMLVLTKNQFQESVRDKILRYYKEKYQFTDQDIINDLRKKDEKVVGDE